MNTSNKIPSSIISKLEQVKLYMAKRRVTAFIGAGFSLNAEMPSHVKMKTWVQLREDFLNKLYGDDEEAKKEDHNDVVHLASLIDAEFKRNELDEILETALPDKLIRPGKLHRMLVRLKWRDILTTNYDTLIERAAEEEIQEYKLVTNKETLLYQPSPRIIKLHGSFPNIRPYIMTKEDYRKYPMEHPEMVNTARQSFLESLMCLIGFSGDDPNFQSWIGWLRDVIGRDRICPTYLITFKKGYHEAEKALMAQLGIDIINLAEIPGIKDFKEAYSFFFNYLLISQENQEWNGKIDPFAYHFKDGQEKEGMEALTEQMTSVRQSYPGWMVLPTKFYEDFKDANERIIFMGRYFDKVDGEWNLKLRFLYEMDWRLTISCTPKNIEWLVPTIEDVIGHIVSPTNEERKIIAGLRFSLLQIYRLEHKRDKFSTLCELLLADSMNIPQGYIKYQQILYAQALLNYKKIQQYLAEWDTDYGEYVDCIHKASVLIMMNSRRDAFDILDKCRTELSKALITYGSDAYISSCLVYVLQLLSYCNDIKYKIPEHLRQGLTMDDFNIYCCKKAYERQPEHGFKVVHNFKIGSYSNSWSLGPGGFVSDYLFPERWFSFKEKIGMIFNVVDEKFYLYSVDKMFQYDWHFAMDKLLITSSGKFVKETLTRKHLSMISRDDANEFFDSYIEYVEKFDDIVNPLLKRIIYNNLVHILGRLCCIITEERILRYVKALTVFDENHVSEIMDYIYDSISSNNLSKIIPLVLENHKIKTPYSRGVKLPMNRTVTFPVEKDLLDKILEGFNSCSSEEQNRSYILLNVIWDNKMLVQHDRRKLETAVRNWRSKIDSDDVLYSYNLVDPLENEQERLNELIAKCVDDFCKGDYTYKGSSVPLSDWAEKLEKVCILNSFLTEEQAIRVFEHIEKMLFVNIDAFTKSNEDNFIFGGIRTDINSIMLLVSEFVCNHTSDIVGNDNLWMFSQCVHRLFEKGYHCLPMLVWLSSDQNTMLMDNGMKEQLENSLFSKESYMRGQAVSAIVYAWKNWNNDITEILNHMFSVLQVIKDKRVVDSLILIERLLMKNFNFDLFFGNKIKSLLTQIIENVNEYDLETDEKIELCYHVNFIAGVASVKYKNQTLLKELNYPYFDLKMSGFNDVFLGYERGMQIAES